MVTIMVDLAKLLEEAQDAAFRLDGSPAVAGGGMASVNLSHNPYKHQWLAYACYSNHHQIAGTPAELPTDTVISLIDELILTRRRLQ